MTIKTLLSGGTQVPALTPTAVKTAAYTAAVGDLVRVDVSGAVRTAYDVQTTTGQATITSATVNFVSGDAGKPITGLMGLIQLPASLLSVQSATAATMSANANITANVIMSIGTPGGLQVTLPPLALPGAQVGVRKTDATGWPITVVGSGSDTVNGVASVALSRPATTTVFTKGTSTDWTATITTPTPIRGAIVNAIGDSIAPAWNGPDNPQNGSGLPSDVLWWAHLLSNSRIIQGRCDGIGGTRADHMAARIDSAAGSGGHWCMIQTGTNDASAGAAPSVWAGYIRQMCSVILGRGQTPILTTPVPRGVTADRLLMDRYRHWLISYAATNGYPIVDFYTLLANPLTGTYKAIYDSGDGTHPNSLAKQAMGQLIADALTPLLPNFTPTLSAVNDTANGCNLVPNGLFVTDTNADGVPDSWAKTGGTATVSLITDTAVIGQALRLTDTTSSGTTTVKAGPTALTGLGGHRVAFTGMIKVVAASAFCNLTVLMTGTPAPVTLRALTTWSGATTPGWQRFYVEGNVPATPSTFSVIFDTSGGTSIDVQCAQLGLYDLTAQGYISPGG